MSLFREMGIKGRVFDGNEGVSHCLILFAEMARMKGRIERAMRLLGASAYIQEPANNWLEPWREKYDEILAASRVQLGDKGFEAAWSEGYALSFEKAASYALETKEAKPGDSFPDGLSNREVQVAVLLVEGLTNREIGERLYISERTVAITFKVFSIKPEAGTAQRLPRT